MFKEFHWRRLEINIFLILKKINFIVCVHVAVRIIACMYVHSSGSENRFFAREFINIIVSYKIKDITVNNIALISSYDVTCFHLIINFFYVYLLSFSVF